MPTSRMKEEIARLLKEEGYIKDYRVVDADPVAQLAVVLEAFGVDPHDRLFSRCIRCNVELEELAELGADAARIPARVRERHSRFWRCPSCEIGRAHV